MNSLQNFLDRRHDDIVATVAALALAGMIMSPLVGLMLLCEGAMATSRGQFPYAALCVAGSVICVLVLYISRRVLVLGATYVTGQAIAVNIESATEETDDTLLKKRGSQGGLCNGRDER